MAALEQLNDFAAALRPRLAGTLRTDAVSRALYATDASLYQMQPLGVLVPRHADDVQAALEVAHAHGVPVLPRGGGSSLAGQAVNAALVVDFTKHLDGLLEINAEEGWARVEPGLVLDPLNAALARHGLMVGPDPASASRATLGGMLGNNATGTHSILYGNLIRHVQAVSGFLADGTSFRFGAVDAEGWAARTRQQDAEGRLYRGLDALLAAHGDVVRRDTPRHWRRNSGYRLEVLLDGPERNLAQLLCGSEGTLAVTTELQLGLVARPRRTALGIAHFATREASLRATTAILETGPAAVELFDGTAIAQTRKAAGFASRLTFVTGDPGGLLFVEYYGETEAELVDRLDALDRTLAGQAYAVVRLLAPEQIQNAWSVRKEGLGIVMGVKGDYKPVALIEDASVPVEHLADYIDALDALLAETGTPAVYYAHASAGCLHVRPFLNTKRADEAAKLRVLAEGSMALVKRFGGALSSEHGDGIARGWLNEAFLGPALTAVYGEVKRLFDPQGTLNPHRILDTPAVDEHLRIGPSYTTIPVLEELDWSQDGGFARAVELCNGNGACRKLHSGTMCPSFMVTREEEHSTRGRANALRAALSGEVDPALFTGERLYEVLDLCIQCKGCKTECPSNVDMAKIKTEWLSKYWQVHRMPLRTRLFAHLPALTRRLPPALAATANWMNRRPAVRRVLERTLGISAARPLPPFATEPFTRWFGKQAWAGGAAATGPAVVLFADTFNNYNHPEVARAAATFFHRAGLRVLVPDGRACCGRPLLSKGLVQEAKAGLRAAVDVLYPFAAEGLPIVGLEPSCILTFVDEALALLPGDARARRVAEAVLTFEQYVARLAESGHLDGIRWQGLGERVLLHGHCHQKALVGTAATERVLRLPGYAVETVDAGCCGMAGAFGYEREHYDVSIQMAERRLAPAVRSLPEGALVAAPGTSCRAQIADTTGRTALHPAEILLAAMAP